MSDVLTLFRDAYLANAEAVPYHAKWVKANPGELALWLPFRDAVLAGEEPTPPALRTKYGRALVAAGRMHMALSRIVGVVVPPAADLPAIITSGGTYSGTRVGTVQIRTTEPVIIQDSIITATGSETLIDANHTGAQLTVRRTYLTGVSGQDGTAIWGNNVQTLTVENCTITYTWGVRVDSVESGGSVLFTKNKGINIQRVRTNPLGFSHFFQTASNGATAFTCEVSWNECRNVWGQGQGSDIISIHGTTGATVTVKDNFLEGSFVDASDTDHTLVHSGSGVMIEDSSGIMVRDNIVVACTNCGIGIASGGSNTVRDNRCVGAGKTPSGDRFGGANVGIYAEDGTGGNQVFGNVIGWMGYPGGSWGRNDAYLPLDGGAWYDDQTYIAPTSAEITLAQEDDEYSGWLTKLSNAGITVGVP